jgi:hypothetical protein
MVARDPGQTARVDSATQSLRQVLLAAEADVQRLRALEIVAQRAIFAPTWPNSPEAVRTLTNSDDEHAMPLFSGLDTLQAAGRRFGWMDGNDSLSFRELPAREVLQSALEQGVHYVVLDMFAAHATEFSRAEIAHVLSRAPASTVAATPASDPRPATTQTGAADAPAARPRAQARPSRRPGAALRSRRPPPPSLAEIDMPFARDRAPTKPVTRGGANAMPQRAASGRVDPRAEPHASRGSRPEHGRVSDPRAEPDVPRGSRPEHGRASDPRADSARSSARVDNVARSSNAGRARANANPASMDALPIPAARPAAPRAPVTPEQQSGPPLDRASKPTPGAFTLPVLPSIPPASTHGQHAARAPLSGAITAGRGGTQRLAVVPPADEPSRLPHDRPNNSLGAGSGRNDDPQPEANSAALEASALGTQVAKLAKDADAQKAAADVAVMLKEMARKGAIEEAKPSAVQSMARAFAGMLSGDGAADAQRARRSKQTEPELAAVEAPAAAQIDALETAGLRPLDPPIDAAVLDAISDALRKYPEVEWACEVSDGTETPVIGLRIDPSFQARAAEVSAAVMIAAQSHNAELSVQMLNHPQLMKEARMYGSAFFPWRKRAGKR